jgi:hypothetical protein
LFCTNEKCFQSKVTKKDKKSFLDNSPKLGRKNFGEVGSEEKRTPHSQAPSCVTAPLVAHSVRVTCPIF